MTPTPAAKRDNKRWRWAGWLQDTDSMLRLAGSAAVWITLPHCKPASKCRTASCWWSLHLFVAGCKVRKITGLDNERERAMFQKSQMICWRRKTRWERYIITSTATSCCRSATCPMDAWTIFKSC